MSENTQSYEPEQIEAMERYSITFDGEKYQFGQYRYDKLEDAVTYARTQEERTNPTRTTQNKLHSVNHAYVPTVSYQSQYGAARIVSMGISFLGWLVFAGGIFAAFIIIIGSGNQYGEGVSYWILLLGLGLAVAGLFLVAAGQITRAVVDSADHTREILNYIKNKSIDTAIKNI